MKFLLQLIVFSLFLLSVTSLSTDWIKTTRTDPKSLITLTIVLKQSNLDDLEILLLQVSDPKSPQYGKHLTLDEVDALTSPSKEAIAALSTFYQQNNIHSFSSSGNLAFSSFTTTIEVAEQLLQTEYYDYVPTSSSTSKVNPISRCESYTIPAILESYVQVVGPTTRFPSLRSFTSLKQHKLQKQKTAFLQAPPNCADGSVSAPDCLRQWYKIPSNTTAIPDSTVAVTGYLEQYISLNDLAKFFTLYDNASIGRVPNVTGPNDPSSPGDEASLDIQYVMGMGHGANATFWYTPGRQPKNPQNEPFLVFLQALASDPKAPWIVSTSYGDDESSVDPDYYQSINTEFQKAGVRGISMLFSSGDSGAGCLNNIFDPIAPATSPWVTSVGATQGYPEDTASFSSGGFSNVWPMPSYQASAVNAFLTNYGKSTLPPANLWNSTGNARAFPDISAAGTNFPIVLDGFVEAVDGTSCSSPTSAGIFSLLNSIRLSNKKSPLGFLNPLIYQNPQAFNDITTGTTVGTGCNSTGWRATTAWDPTTGLGTPNFPELMKVVQNLP